MKKTFEDFKQEVAKKYGFKDWDDLESKPIIAATRSGKLISGLFKEAAELWGQYQREQGKNESCKESWDNGYDMGVKSLAFEREEIANKAWNAALHKAAENAEIEVKTIMHQIGYEELHIIDKDSILKHLKQTDSNKEE